MEEKKNNEDKSSAGLIIDDIRCEILAAELICTLLVDRFYTQARTENALNEDEFKGAFIGLITIFKQIKQELEIAEDKLCD